MRSDDYLVEQVRLGSEAAFEAVYDRYAAQILSFCRHMLGSREEAEDAVQHTFANAYRDLLRSDREINLRPWLYAIARNRCLSLLRSRREETAIEWDVATAGLAEEVEQRAELRQLVHDMRELPEEQRAALLLSELGDLSHADVADILDCEVPRVKALVFRARSGLMERRDAREVPCEEIREQLANLRGGALRRSELRHHLRQCPGCREYREEVKRQRQMIAAILPVIPTAGLKANVLGAVGMGGGSAGGGIAVGLTGATIAKVAAVCVVAGGGIVASDALVGGGQENAAGAGEVSAKQADHKSGDRSVLHDREGSSATLVTSPARGRRGRGHGHGRGHHKHSSTLVLGKEEAARRHRQGAAGAPSGGQGNGVVSPGGGNAKGPKKVNSAPNASPKSNGRGTPQTAPPGPRHGQEVQQTPPPGQTKPKSQAEQRYWNNSDDEGND